MDGFEIAVKQYHLACETVKWDLASPQIWTGLGGMCLLFYLETAGLAYQAYQ